MRAQALARCFLVSILCLAPSFAADSIEEALEEGQVDFDLRYRFEHVDDDAQARNANASTLRLRLGYRTGNHRGFFMRAGFQHTEAVGSERYNSLVNGMTQLPVVADPQTTELDEVFLGYTDVPKTTLGLGRQAIRLGNHRFVGDVGWRQNRQTFDGLTARSRDLRNWTFFVGHLEGRNTVTGGRVDIDSELLRVARKFPLGTLSAYAYLIELQDSPLASHGNLGLRFEGQQPLSKTIDLLFNGEYAEQTDHAGGAATIDAEYLLVEVGADFARVNARVGYEQLGGDGVYGFQTPLATLHAFNGWADKFLSTPAAGLVDSYIAATLRQGPYKATAVYHDFESDSGGADYGSELDLAVTRAFGKRYAVGLKFAGYDADGFSTDAEKWWISMSVKQ